MRRMSRQRWFRFYFTIIISLFLTFNMAVPAVAVEGTSGVNILRADKGAVTLSYSLNQGKKFKVMVEKNGKSLYYNLNGSSGSETFPLQMGSGTYTIAVLENVSGNKYRYLAKETVNLEDASGAFLQSVQLIDWDYNDPAIKKSQELVQGKKSDAEKLDAIYRYIVSNFTYDYGKLDKLPSNYLPDINSTFKSRKGICYDFSSLFAAMLRSVDIPAKLVKGYGDNVEGYHAWNEVCVDGKWKVIDISYDIQMREYSRQFAMYKNSSQYDKVSEF